MSAESFDFVFRQRAVEKMLREIDVPKRCGIDTCGMDIAITRDESTNELQVQLLELNARVNMAHYAMAAKRKVPRGKSRSKFGV